MIIPKEFGFKNMAIDITVSIASVHQMIIQYICCFFNSVAFDPKIGILSFEQLIMILKNKFINLSNEDHLLIALDNWISYNTSFLQNIMDHESQGWSKDNGVAIKQLQDLIDNVNWPIISVEALIQVLLKPNGVMKRLSTIQSKIF